MQNLDSLSKFLSLILRHKPEIIGIKLDKNGWADVEELISGINRTGRRLTYEMLKEIVLTDNKQRYSFSENHLKIRANQGHSINVDVELCEPSFDKIPRRCHSCGQVLKSMTRKEADAIRPEDTIPGVTMI